MSGRKESRFFYGYVLVIAGFFIMVAMYGTLYSFGIFLKPVLDELGWTRTTVSGAYSLCFLLSGLLSMISGRLSDRFGPRKVISCSGVLLGAGYLLMSNTSTVRGMYLYYGLLAGAGMSGGIAPVCSTITKWFIRRRGLMTGIVLAGVGTGTLIVPPIVNLLVAGYGWRTSMALAGSVTFVLVTGLAQLFIQDPGKKGILPYGAEGASIQTMQCDMAGIALRKTICNAQLWILFAIYVFAGFFIQIVVVHIAAYAISLGFSMADSAFLLSIVGIGGLIGRVAGGSTSDRIEGRVMMVVSMVSMTAGFIWLLVSSRLWMLSCFAILFGFAYGEILCMMPLLPAWLFGLRNHGAILGIITFASTFGGSIGPVAAGRIFDVTGSYRMVWIVCIAVSVAGLILAVFINKVRVKL